MWRKSYLLKCVTYYERFLGLINDKWFVISLIYLLYLWLHNMCYFMQVIFIFCVKMRLVKLVSSCRVQRHTIYSWVCGPLSTIALNVNFVDSGLKGVQNQNIRLLMKRENTVPQPTWDVVAPRLRWWLLTGGLWARLPLWLPRRDLGQVLYLQLPVRFGVKLRYSIRAVVGSASE